MSNETKHTKSRCINRLIRNLPWLAWLKDPDGKYLACNSEFERFYGASESNILGKTDCDFVAKSHADLLREKGFLAAKNDPTTVNEEWLTYASDGKKRLLETTKISLYDDNNEIIGVLGLGVNVTTRKENELSLKKIILQYQTVLETTKDGFWRCSNEGKILDVNNRYCQMSGFSREELLEKTVWDLDVLETQEDLVIKKNKILAESSAIFESVHKRADGSTYPVEVIVSLSNVEEDFAFVFIRDISDRKIAEHRIQQMAYYDELTGLPNRQLLGDRLKKAISHAKRNETLIGVCFIDLDGFKLINDQHDHSVGDKMLIKVARRMQQKIREEDTLSRLGGDEFVIVLNDLVNVEEGEHIVTRIIDSFQQPFLINKSRLHVSASVGITFYPHDNNDADTLLRHADHAMYQAKNSGKNRYKLFEAIKNSIENAHQKILREFAHALANDELELFYQPRITLQTGNVSGFEALIRWNHPQRGLLEPEDFIPLIKDHPLELGLDEWVITRALNQHVEWRKQGKLINISVNICPRFLCQWAFYSYITEQLKYYPTDIAQYIEFEVIEHSEIENDNNVSEIKLACQHLGLRFSIDDFGTGYSSLTYVHGLNFNTLKIDKSFVKNMLTHQTGRNIVDGAIRIAEIAELPVVAEGVENMATGQLLFEMGCQFAQGYGIAPPMDTGSVFPWLTSHSKDSEWKRLTEKRGINFGKNALDLAKCIYERRTKAIYNYVNSPGRSQLTEGNAYFSQLNALLNEHIPQNASAEIKNLAESAYSLHHKLNRSANEVVELVNQRQLVEASTQMQALELQFRKFDALLSRLSFQLDGTTKGVTK